MVMNSAATVRTLIELKLRSALSGFGFRQAANGLVAIESIVLSPPAVVVLDVSMPVLDGSSVLLLLRHAIEGASPALMDRLAGGARVRGDDLKIAGVDSETLRVTDPFHPRRPRH